MAEVVAERYPPCPKGHGSAFVVPHPKELFLWCCGVCGQMFEEDDETIGHDLRSVDAGDTTGSVLPVPGAMEEIGRGSLRE